MDSKIRILQSFNLKHKTPHSIIFTQMDKFSKKNFLQFTIKASSFLRTFMSNHTYQETKPGWERQGHPSRHLPPQGLKTHHTACLPLVPSETLATQLLTQLCAEHLGRAHTRAGVHLPSACRGQVF